MNSDSKKELDTGNNTLVIIEDNHPLYLEIKKNYKTKSPEEALNGFKSYDLIIDLSALRTKSKMLLLKELGRTTKADIISDLTLSWGEIIMQQCTQVTGALSLLFFSPTDSVEFTARNEKSEMQIRHFLNTLGKKGLIHQNLKIGFHYPRVISMIVNEAHFALEENLATPEAIDLAMKNGVNYPLGPVEWGEKIKLKYIVQLLSELHEITEDSRYRISTHLKLMAQT